MGMVDDVKHKAFPVSPNKHKHCKVSGFFSEKYKWPKCTKEDVENHKGL